MKGKKFTAAEKHFTEQLKRKNNQNKLMSEEIDRLMTENENLKTSLHEKEGEIYSLKEWIERLLDYTELPKEEIKNKYEEDIKKEKLTKAFLNLAFGCVTAGALPSYSMYTKGKVK